FAESRHVEADGETLHTLAGQLAHRPSDHAGVDSTAEQHAHRHIGHHALLDGAAHMLPNTRDVLLDGAPLSFGEAEIPVTFLADSPILKEEPMAWRKLVDVGEEGLWAGHVAHAEEIRDGLGIGLPPNAWAQQKRLNLGGEGQATGDARIIERLLAG